MNDAAQLQDKFEVDFNLGIREGAVETFRTQLRSIDPNLEVVEVGPWPAWRPAQTRRRTDLTRFAIRTSTIADLVKIRLAVQYSNWERDIRVGDIFSHFVYTDPANEGKVVKVTEQKVY